jgi:hypothetical protein
LRTTISVELSRQSSELAHSYNLGVNLGIAEVFASMDKARQTIYISLTNARTEAQALSLPTQDLDECIAFVGGTTPLSEIQSRLVTLRATYQATL